MELEREQAERVRAGRLALVAGAAIFAGKVVAFLVTGSSAVFSDAMESVVNVVAASLLLYSLIVAARPPDPGHPYGHGKVEFFSAGVEGALIALAALAILVEAGGELLRGPEVRRLDAGLAILVLLSAANGGLGVYLVRTGQRTGSLALVADGRHVLTDVWTSVGVVIGLAVVWLTGWVVLDPLVAIAVAVNVLRQGYLLAREAVGGLMDEAPDDLLATLASALDARREPEWIDVHSLRAWRSGRFTHADVHVVVPRYLDADRLHDLDGRVDHVVSTALEGPSEVIVHFDPCRPRLCPRCEMAGCKIREAPFEARFPWSRERATRVDESLETGEPLVAFHEGTEVFVAFGSNVGDRAAHLRAGAEALAATRGVEPIAYSHVYETDPVGPPPQGPYLNAVMELRTTLTPTDLLARLLEIERQQGRTRGGERNAARTLDLDLLDFGGRCLDEPGLELPHPRLHERGFVLVPFAELAGDRLHARLGEPIEELADRVGDPAAVRPWRGPAGRGGGGPWRSWP
ncbi:MAG TPA: 2-amino-4-hydroxy-6-hydroxymethyldihydropteridine diphosphokinase [Myxococcota bacterium]|nr:2-amino-4-hydroxy-6-hydroxymethyldihydropteridine diphosphokinase [Myxococcota bacterium]